MKTSNPAFKKVREAIFAHEDSERMSVQGTVNKSVLLFALLLSTGIFTFYGMVGGLIGTGVMWFGLIGGIIMAIVTISNPNNAYWSAPVYALLEGIALGAITGIYGMQLPHIVLPAITLTLGVLGIMLVLYKTGIIKVTQKFRTGVMAATGAIAITYLVNIILSLFGMNLPFLHDGGMISIGISLVIVGVAALNLVLDFDAIEQGSQAGAPKVMEWFAAFGLMLTLVWLYLEILRLLSYLSSD